ncbi:hypothetical protein HHK36_008584 [Tetracentron sinense]|uniref:CRM domain-containing protein n=1 Tax=Tetracentron sinense TaxID=13715 RepID=A0A834ZJA5_TETSI|nr:hypothetical protein HHK36_008584 [Tetracentron sinense]
MAASSHQLHHLFRPPSSLLPVKPLCTASTTLCLQIPFLNFFSSRSSLPRPRFFCNSSSLSSLTNPQTPSPYLLHEDDSDSFSEDELVEEEDDEEIEPQIKEIELGETLNDRPQSVATSSVLKRNGESIAKLPSLTVKEKKELSAYAHSLGKKLKSQQVGKSGVTSSVAASFLETLEANELLKPKLKPKPLQSPNEEAVRVKHVQKRQFSVGLDQIQISCLIGFRT